MIVRSDVSDRYGHRPSRAEVDRIVRSTLARAVPAAGSRRRGAADTYYACNDVVEPVGQPRKVLLPNGRDYYFERGSATASHPPAGSDALDAVHDFLIRWHKRQEHEARERAQADVYDRAYRMYLGAYMCRFRGMEARK